jgi:predicted RND superfamily exporter protein
MSSGGFDDADEGFIGTLNRAFARIAGWSYDHRWFVMLACLALLAGAQHLAGQARIDNSYEAYFDPADPIFTAYEKYRDDFGSDEVSYILYEAPGYEHGPWNLDVMRRIVELTQTLEDEVPFIYEVKTLANAELTLGVPGGIDIRELADEFPETQAELLALRDLYLAKPMFVGGLTSESGEHGAIIIEMDRSSTDPVAAIQLDPDAGWGMDNLYPQVTDAAIEEILARPEYAGIEFFHSGDVPLNAVYNRLIDGELQLLAQIASGVIAVILVLFFRSLLGIVGPILIVQAGVILCIALLALLGWKIDMGFSNVPTLLVAIGVAHSVHIISEFRALFAELGDRREALVQSLYLVGTPCLLAALTTAVGFGSMSFVPIKSIAHQGVVSSFGVMATYALSLTLLMALLSFGSKTPKAGTSEAARARAKGGRWMQQGLAAVAEFNVRHRIALLSVFAVIFAVSAVGLTKIQVDSNWLDDFSYDMPIKANTEHVDEVMGGTTNLIYLFDSGEPEGIKEPAVLREIERVAAYADLQKPLVRKTYSIVDILKDLNQAFHEDDPAYYRLPETRELVAQYLLLYETSGGEEAEKYVSPDYRRASLELRLKLAPTSQTAELAAGIDAMLAANPLEASTIEMTGIGALWLKLMDYIVSSQIQGFTLAFLAIALMMIFIFRSLKTGLISMIPNLAPVVLTLGVMGWGGILLDYNKVTIAAVAIGIAVDDTIHMISRYRHEFLLCGNYQEALVTTMQDVGRALLITSVALVLGFLVFVFSVLAAKAMFGILLATSIVVALVADFLLMPALVLTFKPFGPEGVRAAQPLDRAA